MKQRSEIAMRRGTIGILCVSAAIGLGTAVAPPIINDRDCQARLTTWTSEHDAGREQLDRRSVGTPTPFMQGSHDAPQWKPVCRRSEDAFNFGMLGLSLFLTLFTGSYACWLLSRVCSMTMRRLTGRSTRVEVQDDRALIVWSVRDANMLRIDGARYRR
ncbi:hypothetical protein [Caballeronia telluris]|nr:hypothetical protein [Caballeronia telluris]